MALGDETRLSLLARLSSTGPLSITVLTEGTVVSRQAVSKHLHVLEGAGLVRATRLGRERVWELEPKRLAEAKRYLDAVSEQWDEALERLRVFVEDPE